jgi:GT2 family glycosyltransferase/glycosyltransferase involved in cell wall biosynthesis
MTSKSVLILGMHRSGTSALAGAIGLAGVDLGPNLTPGREDNPRGFFEHDEIWRLHQRLLEELGSDWDDFRALPAGWQDTAAAAEASAGLSAILARDFADVPLWGVKEPRMSRLFALWPRLVHDVGAEPKAILALRHPLETARSLRHRNGIAIAHGLALWLRYTLDGERCTRATTRAVQHYPDLLSDWRAELARLDAALGLGLPERAPDTDAKLAAFLDADLRHQRSAEDADDWGDAGMLEAWCGTAYTAMLAPGVPDCGSLDAIAAEFAAWEHGAAAFGDQIAYRLRRARQQDGTIDWLEGERTKLVDFVEKQSSEHEAAHREQVEAITTLTGDRDWLADERRKLLEERDRTAEERRLEVAGHEGEIRASSQRIQALVEERTKLIDERTKLIDERTRLTEERTRLAEERRREVAEHATELGVRSQRIQMLLEERERLALARRNEADAYEARLEQLSDAIRDEIAYRHQAELDLAAADRGLEQLRMKLAHTEQTVVAMHRSTSWRVTAPMRRTMRALRRESGRPDLGAKPRAAIAQTGGTPEPADAMTDTPDATSVATAATAARRGARIVIVTPDIHGPVRNGGIGTAFSALAVSLARWGYGVSVLYALGDYTESEPVAHWRQYYDDLGVTLIPLDSEALDELPELQASRCAQFAWKVHLWLSAREHDFALAIFPEWMGLAYYVLLAKGQGLAYGGLPIAVNAHSPENWAMEGNRALPDDTDMLDREYMERETVRRANWLISPSQYMLTWMLKHQWRLPARRVVIQNLLSEAALQDQPEDAPAAIGEIVFFGRLEFRKGLKLFCDAIDRLSPEQRGQLDRIVFLGKTAIVVGYDSTRYIRQRSAAWNLPVDILTDRNREQALAYLSRPGVLAITASLSENSPYTVLECLHHRICFLATAVGGIPELIHLADRRRTLFEPNPASLTQRIAEALELGSQPARMAVPQDNVREMWRDWLDTATAMPVEPPAASAPTNTAGLTVESSPLVSVCLVHYDRPHMLTHALDSLRAQTYRNFEVVLVDDGSPSDAAQAFLDSLEPEFEARNWKIVRQSNRYLGAARNQAAHAADGAYLLFMDDDNYAMPDEIAVFVQAALHSRADILTCVAKLFHGEGPPERVAHYWLPLGGAVGPGLYRNVFGDANALWKRDAFLRTGGYTTDYGVGHEDWELFAEATLSGLRLETVPQALFWYRVHGGSMLRSGDVWADHARSVRPYVRHDPAGIGFASAYGVCLLQSRITTQNGTTQHERGLSGWRRASNAIVLASSPRNVARFFLTWNDRGLRHALRKTMTRSTIKIGARPGRELL